MVVGMNMISYAIREAFHSLQSRAVLHPGEDLSQEIAAVGRALSEQFDDASPPRARLSRPLPWYGAPRSLRRAAVAISGCVLLGAVELLLLYAWVAATIP